MCFSAEASIAAGAILIPAGVYCVTTALRKNSSYLLVGATPLLFGVQQFSEAAVWIGLKREDPGLIRIGALAFLFVAVAFWPCWVNLIAAGLEPNPKRRRLFLTLAAAGLALGGALYMPAALHYDEWLKVGIVGHSIRYDLTQVPLIQSTAGIVWQGLYLALISIPTVMSRERAFQVLGATVAVAAVLTHLMFRYAFISVWCFFAAFLSIQICSILYRLPNIGRGVRPISTGV